LQVSTIIRQMNEAASDDLPVLQRILENLEIDPKWLRSQIPDNLSSEQYHRQVLHQAGNYEVGLVCWPVACGTMIHDHGSDRSHGMVRILKGQVFNRIYQRSGENGVRLVDEQVSETGALLPVPVGLIHSMGNHSDDELAMSLHLYCPTIINVSFWDPITLEPVKV